MDNATKARHPTRRDLLAGMAVLGLGSLVPKPLYAQQRVRQSVTGNNTDPAMLDAYKRAIRAMLQLPPSDPRNWYRQALVHLLDCPHRNWWFLPWHRGYLFHLEQMCAQLSNKPDFALPFWDWTAAPRVPDVMFGDVLTPTNAAYEASFVTFRTKFQPAIQTFFNGLSPQARNDLSVRGYPSISSIMGDLQASFSSRANARGLTPQNPSFAAQFAGEVTIERVRQVLTPLSFETFGSDQAAQHSDGPGEGPLETGPHDNVHGAVGGFMGAFMSPVDPIFYMHHANIDRLWALWTKREKSQGRTGHPAANADWIKEPFRFFSNANGQLLPTATAGDYVDETTLGYSYGPGSGESALLPAAVAAANITRFASTAAKVPLKTFSPTSLAVQMPDDTLSRVASPPGAAATAAVPQTVARLTIEPPSQAKKYSVRVYVNCPYLNKDTPINDPHYVGSIKFFGVEHSAHKGARTYTLPLGQTLRRLDEVGRPIGNQIQVQTLTIDNTGQVKTLDGALAKVEIMQG